MSANIAESRIASLEDENQWLRDQVAALKEDATRFRTFVEGADDLITRVDATGVFTYVNPTAARIFGRTAAECINTSAFDVIHPDDRASTQQAFLGWVQNQVTHATFENRLVHRDGAIFHMLWTINLFYEDDGRLAYANSICRDIGARKQSEQELQMAQYTLDRAADLITWTNMDGQICYANNAACTALGYTRAELLDMTMSQIDRAMLPAKVPAFLAALRQDATLAIATTFTRKDGSALPVEVSASIVEFGGQEYIVTYARDISARQASEEELKRFRDIIHTTPVAISVAPISSGLLEYSNPAYCDLLGYSADELAGMPLPQVFGEDPAYIMDLFGQCIAQGHWQGELRYRRKDGAIFPAYLTANILYDAAGAPQAAVGFVQDLSAQKQQDEELRLFRALVEDALDGIGWASMDGTMRFGNAAFRALTGFGDRVIGSSIAEYFDAETLAQISNDVFPALAEHGRWQGMLRYRRPDASSFIGQVSAFVLKDDATGAPIAQTVIMRDVTAQKQQEDELRTFKLLVENAPDGIAISDLSSVFTYVNPAYQEMLGYATSLVGMDSALAIAPDDRERVAQVAQQVMAAGSVRGQLRYLRADGATFEAQISGLLLRDEEGNPVGFASINRDITEQLRVEHERQALQEQVIMAQQAALHELSTPLMPIASGVVAMPIVGAIDSSRAQQMMEALLEGIARHDADIAILDITGVKVVDTQVAGALIRTAQAARLLGTQVVLSGIGPEIAQTLVHIGADMRDMIAKRSLQQGIAYALEQRG